MDKQKVEYDNKEWQGSELVLYREEKEVDRIFADEIMQNWMDENRHIEYVEI